MSLSRDSSVAKLAAFKRAAARRGLPPVAARSPDRAWHSLAQRCRRWIWCSLALLLSLVVARPSYGASQNLLAGLDSVETRGVLATKHLTDGFAVGEGEYWKTNRVARFQSKDSSVVFDLGQARTIRAVWLQGDNNDVYEVSISQDGRQFRPLWVASKVRESGMRARFTNELSASGRYLRVSVRGGDDSCALSEVQAFETPGAEFPPRVPRKKALPLEPAARSAILLFGLSLIAWLFLTSAGAPRWLLGVATLVPVAGAWHAFDMLSRAWPLGSREVSLVRGVTAVVAAAAVFREVMAPPRWRANRAVVLTTLGVCAFVGVSAFYNLLQPQFFDAKKGERTFAHYLDLRQYYTTAKYFPEIGYRDIYRADVAAYVADTPARNLDRMASTPMRDLDTLQVSSVAAERARIERIVSQFSKERWQAYRQDTRHFREAMGERSYFDTMYDMGGNATPVWMSIAHVLFNQVPPSTENFMLTALLDPLLLLAAFVAIGMTFGLRTMFVCMVIFGANDFIMYGTNWAGATLRHDWLAYLGLGACALKRRRWLLAGALLGLSATIRAFPAVAVLAVAVPAGWWVWEHYKSQKKLPSWRTLWDEQKPVLLIFAGAAAAVVVLFGFSAAVLGAHAWQDWLDKVRSLSHDPHANHISLRSLIAGWEEDQHRVLATRWPVFAAAAGLIVGAIVVSLRARSLHQAAVMGLILVPVLFYPANYYLHLVFLLPLLAVESRRAPCDEAAERQTWLTRLKAAIATPSAKSAASSAAPTLTPADGWIWVTLLLMCAVQYWTVPITDRGLHFYLGSAVLFCAVTVLLAISVYKQPMVRRLWATDAVPVATQDAVPASGAVLVTGDAAREVAAAAAAGDATVASDAAVAGDAAVASEVPRKVDGEHARSSA